MTVAELKKLLEKFPDDYEVILSEGNGFSPMAGDHSLVEWDGDECFSPEEDEDEESDSEFTPNAIVLWPI